jgi:RNA polymerase sigma factor (sigma-70 family)
VSIAAQLERYFRPLLNYTRTEIAAHEALGNLEPGELTAEDVVDEALAEAMRLPDEPRDHRVYPWLRRLVRRTLQQHVRQHRRERSLFEPVGVGRPDDDGSTARQLIDILPDPSSPIPEDVVASWEFQRALASILRQLPTRWREPFLLHVRDGQPIRDVAQLEGAPVAEVRQRIDRAREFLRAKLEDEYQDGEIPAPTEEIFQLLDRVEPTPEQLERLRTQLQAAA